VSRIEQLTEILAENPTDAFARYSLALEYANSGETETALSEFRKLLSQNPDYVPGYQMLAQTMMRAGMNAEAGEMLRNGIEAATRVGNTQARSEMEGMLEDLGIE
jgi:Tfp pilus assembly protein PilF